MQLLAAAYCTSVVCRFNLRDLTVFIIQIRPEKWYLGEEQINVELPVCEECTYDRPTSLKRQQSAWKNIGNKVLELSQRRQPIVGQVKRRVTKIRSQAVRSGSSSVLRTAINADRKWLVMSYPVWLWAKSAWMSVQHLVDLS